jgi:hypothetical protein
MWDLMRLSQNFIALICFRIPAEQDCMLDTLLVTSGVIFFAGSSECMASTSFTPWDGMRLGCLLNNMQLRPVYIQPKLQLLRSIHTENNFSE